MTMYRKQIILTNVKLCLEQVDYFNDEFSVCDLEFFELEEGGCWVVHGF